MPYRNDDGNIYLIQLGAMFSKIRPSRLSRKKYDSFSCSVAVSGRVGTLFGVVARTGKGLTEPYSSLRSKTGDCAPKKYGSARNTTCLPLLVSISVISNWLMSRIKHPSRSRVEHTSCAAREYTWSIFAAASAFDELDASISRHSRVNRSIEVWILSRTRNCSLSRHNSISRMDMAANSFRIKRERGGNSVRGLSSMMHKLPTL
jgi:hypothetical protein